jgi:hypothetical protein
MKKITLWMSCLLFGLMIAGCSSEEVQPDLVLEDAVAKANQGIVKNFRAHLDDEGGNGTKATGQAIFQLSKDGTTMSYKLIVANIENVFMAHIHEADNPGSDGGIAVWLTPGPPAPPAIPGRTDGILAEGTFDSGDVKGGMQGLLEAIAEGRAYVNVHTSLNRSGEIRGDIK